MEGTDLPSKPMARLRAWLPYKEGRVKFTAAVGVVLNIMGEWHINLYTNVNGSQLGQRNKRLPSQ